MKPGMSPPAEKARPAPVSTMARTERSRARWFHTSCMAVCISSLNAFNLSGRFIVTTATEPSISIRSSSVGVKGMCSPMRSHASPAPRSGNRISWWLVSGSRFGVIPDSSTLAALTLSGGLPLE